MTTLSGLAHDHDADAPRRAGTDDTRGPDDPTGDPADASIEDWAQADKARPTLPEETEDGLDDLEEEIRHQAEDLPLDTPGRTE